VIQENNQIWDLSVMRSKVAGAAKGLTVWRCQLPARHSGQAKREPESRASLERLQQLDSRIRGNDEKNQTQAFPV